MAHLDLFALPLDIIRLIFDEVVGDVISSREKATPDAFNNLKSVFLTSRQC